MAPMRQAGFSSLPVINVLPELALSPASQLPQVPQRLQQLCKTWAPTSLQLASAPLQDLGFYKYPAGFSSFARLGLPLVSSWHLHLCRTWAPTSTQLASVALQDLGSH